MSVYAKRRKKHGDTVYVYDFVIKGARFLSPTHYPTKAAAQAAERLRRTRIAEGKDDEREQLTLDQAAGRYWEDVGRHHRSAAQIEKRVETVIRLIGAHRRLVDIRTSTVNDAIQKRRREPVENVARTRGQAKAKGKALAKYQAPKMPSNATVNRDVIDTLRPIINHAAEIYELALPRIAWKKLRLKERGELVREFTAAEIEAWAGELKWIERVFLGIALTYGPRFGEMFFPPSAVRVDAPGGPELELGRYKGRSGAMRTSRKDGSLHTLYLADDHAALLAHLAARASEARLDVLWFVETPSGRLSEISYWGMRQRLLDGARRAGIDGERILHGMRHHAGTTILRRSRNLTHAQGVLGHKQITTTRRYAHVTKDDLRASLADVSRHNPAALTPALPKPATNQEDEAP